MYANGIGHQFGYSGMLIPILIIGFFIWIIWIILSKNIKQQDNGNQNKSAIDFLKERYAKGEIDKTEFDRIKKDIL